MDPVMFWCRDSTGMLIEVLNKEQCCVEHWTAMRRKIYSGKEEEKHTERMVAWHQGKARSSWPRNDEVGLSVSITWYGKASL